MSYDLPMIINHYICDVLYRLRHCFDFPTDYIWSIFFFNAIIFSLFNERSNESPVCSSGFTLMFPVISTSQYFFH